jgi:hypothetical protein
MTAYPDVTESVFAESYVALYADMPYWQLREILTD